MRVGVASGAGILAAFALAGCGEGVVVRVVDGRPEAGRFISEGAYALYARGAEEEARGEPAAALAAFGAAAREDPESPEIWTRIGALRCRLGAREAAQGGEGDDAEAFARAEAIDPAYGPLHRERARCWLGRAGGDPGRALVEAERALALDPDDAPTALVYGAALERAGRREDARRAFVAAAVRRRVDFEAWRALADFGRRNQDAALASAAGEQAAALSPPYAPAPAPDRIAPRALPGPAYADAPLVAGDLAEARRRAREARLPAGELAVRAALLGVAPFAREQATLALGADPADASARIALAAVADLQGDLAALDATMRALPRRSTPPSPLARLLFAEVLARRTGAEAARAWLGAPAAAGDPGDDPLLAATARRVRGALGVLR